MAPASLIALLVGSIHAGLLIYSARVNFITVDKPAHFAAGVAHWRTGSFVPYRVNPPLPRMIAVLLPLSVGVEDPIERFVDVPGYRSEGVLGHDLLQTNWDRYIDLIWLARFSGLAWSLFGC